MPTRSAVLSFVPNQAIARSFSHGGTRSMKAEPIATTGVCRVPSRPATTLPAANPANAASTPPTAARHQTSDPRPSPWLESSPPCPRRPEPRPASV